MHDAGAMLFPDDHPSYSEDDSPMVDARYQDSVAAKACNHDPKA